MEITRGDINLFYQSGTRSTNDAINKKRETILCKLGNKVIEEEWIHTDERWNQVNTGLQEKIDELTDQVEEYA